MAEFAKYIINCNLIIYKAQNNGSIVGAIASSNELYILPQDGQQGLKRVAVTNIYE
jgi:hypothetical protein